MHHIRFRIIFGASLLALSLLLYLLHYLIFKDVHHIFLYLISDIAFIPINVLVVAIIIDQLLKSRERRSILNKLNMVIGAFFSEMGVLLLRYFALFDNNFSHLSEKLIMQGDWSVRHFATARREIRTFEYKIDSRKGDLEALRAFLAKQRRFLLSLLENPNLLEHESFTELLWAVTHVGEELAYRDNVSQLSNADYDHLSGDIKRAYTLLIYEWLSYMQHLKARYPYLFSLAIRINPFNPFATVDFK